MNSNLPSDTELSQKGATWHSSRAGVLIIACGALAREILALREQHGLQHIDLVCLPAILHNHPEKLPDAVEKAIQKHQKNYASIALAYADCGTGGQLEKICARYDVPMIAGPHCYSFFEGNDIFAQKQDTYITAFFLTDFLVRQFDAFVWKPLGLDRYPQLRNTYFAHYTHLIYQSQYHDPALITLARQHAERLGLAFEHVHTGYGDLETWITEQTPQHSS